MRIQLQNVSFRIPATAYTNKYSISEILYIYSLWGKGNSEFIFTENSIYEHDAFWSDGPNE
jgi:hypothetical protein